MRTADQFDIFNGALDRYDWTLVGRKEMYVPYNSYKLHSDALRYTDIIKPNHLNPDHLRYELHRVWVVEAKVKADTNHIYSRRTLYLDEDSWQVLAADHYDSRGQIWRVAEAHVISVAEAHVISMSSITTRSRRSGRRWTPPTIFSPAATPRSASTIRSRWPISMSNSPPTIFRLTH